MSRLEEQKQPQLIKPKSDNIFGEPAMLYQQTTSKDWTGAGFGQQYQHPRRNTPSRQTMMEAIQQNESMGQASGAEHDEGDLE